MQGFAQIALYQATAGKLSQEYVQQTGMQPPPEAILNFQMTESKCSTFLFWFKANNGIGIYGNQKVSRTGYYEKDLVNYNCI